jgi:hypothetical protein
MMKVFLNPTTFALIIWKLWTNKLEHWLVKSFFDGVRVQQGAPWFGMMKAQFLFLKKLEKIKNACINI